MLPAVKLYCVESPVRMFGVTIVWPSWLIQWACGLPRPMSMRRSTPAASGASSITASGRRSPLLVTCTWSVSVRVITCAGASPTETLRTSAPVVRL